MTPINSVQLGVPSDSLEVDIKCIKVVRIFHLFGTGHKRKVYNKLQLIFELFRKEIKNVQMSACNTNTSIVYLNKSSETRKVWSRKSVR